MAADVRGTRERVQRFLTEWLGHIEVDSEGDFTFPHETTRVWITVRPFGEESSAVSVYAYTNLEVPPTPELFRHIATSQYIFGHLGAEEEDGNVRVIFRSTLLGDFMDEGELQNAVLAVALTADGIDDEIQSRFGGRRFVDLQTT